MKILCRSVSQYQKQETFDNVAPRRQVSVPANFYQQEEYDDDILPAQLNNDVLECLKDAAGLFAQVYNKMMHSPESIDSDYIPENVHFGLSDAEQLLPALSRLVTDNKPDCLYLVQDFLTKLQERIPNLEPLNIAHALHAVKNATVLLHLDNRDGIDVNTLITQPRDFIAAAMIVNQYLMNLASDNSHIY